MFGLGPQELFLITLMVLVLFGPKSLPQVARTIGKAVNNFNKASKVVVDEFKLAAAEEENPKQKPKKSKA
jgi:TatA/E family protein of Tat protein translocase